MTQDGIVVKWYSAKCSTSEMYSLLPEVGALVMGDSVQAACEGEER